MSTLCCCGTIVGFPIITGLNAGVGALSALALRSSLGAGGGALFGMGFGGAVCIIAIPTAILVHNILDPLYQKLKIPMTVANIATLVISAIAAFFGAAALIWVMGSSLPFTAILALGAVQISFSLLIISAVGIASFIYCIKKYPPEFNNSDNQEVIRNQWD